MHMRRLCFAPLALIARAAPASAQDKRYDINIGGGAEFPIGSYKDSFDTGGTFAIGGTYFITPMIGIQGEYNYNRMDGPEKTISISSLPGGPITNSALLQSNQHMHVGLFDLVVRAPHRDSMISGYVLGGGGLYNRTI